MELRHLRYFAAVAELRNVTQAARRLHVAQPALSRQIQDLEEELGLQLIERSTRGIKLTEAGKFFAAEAGAVLARADEALQAVRALARGEIGELRVGYAPSPTSEVLPRALAAFQKVAPGVRVTRLDLASDDLESALLDERVHLSVMVKPGSRPQPGILFEEIVRYSLWVAVARRHRFARMAKVPLRRLLDEPSRLMLERSIANTTRCSNRSSRISIGNQTLPWSATGQPRCVRQSNLAVVSRWCPRSSAAWPARA
jgi:DNA-binding transcriptional LysR family regulator